MKHLVLLFFAASLSLGIGAAALAADAPWATVTVPISAQNGSGVSGSATMVQHSGDVLVTITLTGAGAGPEPAHIHTGTCANLDPTPKYPLSNIVDGKSVTTVKDVTLRDLESSDFAINVHKSTDDLKTYVACGNIPMPATPK